MERLEHTLQLEHAFPATRLESPHHGGVEQEEKDKNEKKKKKKKDVAVIKFRSSNVIVVFVMTKSNMLNAKGMNQPWCYHLKNQSCSFIKECHCTFDRFLATFINALELLLKQRYAILQIHFSNNKNKNV